MKWYFMCKLGSVLKAKDISMGFLDGAWEISALFKDRIGGGDGGRAEGIMGCHLWLVPAGLSNGQNSVRLKFFFFPLFCTHTRCESLWMAAVLELASTPWKHILEQNNKTQSVLPYPQTLAVRYWNIWLEKHGVLILCKYPWTESTLNAWVLNNNNNKKRADNEMSNK